MPLNPGFRLPASRLSCALCRGGPGPGPEAGTPGAGTDPVQLCPQLLPLAPSGPRSGPGRVGQSLYPPLFCARAFLAVPERSLRQDSREQAGGLLLLGLWPLGWGCLGPRRGHSSHCRLLCPGPSACSCVPGRGAEVGKVGVCSGGPESGPPAAPTVGRPRPVTRSRRPHGTCRWWVHGPGERGQAPAWSSMGDRSTVAWEGHLFLSGLLGRVGIVPCLFYPDFEF